MIKFLFLLCLVLLTGCGEYSLKEYDAPSASYQEARNKLKSWGHSERVDGLIIATIDKLEERVRKLELASSVEK